ncbi:MAG: 3-hydroxyacyl-ACP dehydratase FabZ family protein [Myxococcota bacterium]
MTEYPHPAALIPHRPPMLYIDRVVSVEGFRVVCERAFAPHEFPGHFPGRPIVPGVVMLEGLAQALACLGALGGELGQAVLTGVEKARFRGLVEPPATLVFDVEVTDRRFGVVWASGVVRQGDREVCTAKLQAAILPADGGVPPA